MKPTLSYSKSKDASSFRPQTVTDIIILKIVKLLSFTTREEVVRNYFYFDCCPVVNYLTCSNLRAFNNKQ